MNSRGCAFVILVLILAVLAWGILSSALDLPEALPEISWPSIKEIIPTLGSVQIGVPTPSNSLIATQAPRPTITLFPTPSEKIVQNGRLLFAGFDGAVWSAEVEGGTAVQLGSALQNAAIFSNAWYSPDGRYVLVVRNENSAQVVYLVRTDGKIPELRLGPLSAELNSTTPRNLFAFSSDRRRFFYLDTSTNPANLIVVTLEDFKSFLWPVQASADEITFASFWGDGDHLVLKSFDANLDAHFLEVFQVNNMLADPRRIAVREGYQIIQFAVSPNAEHLAIVFRRFGGAQVDELSVFDLRTGTSASIEAASDSKIYLPSPAWSPDGRYLLFSSWQGASGSLVYALSSFDTNTGVMANLIAPIETPVYGLPFCQVVSFSPDGLGIAVRLYEDVSDEVSTSILLMDGSYRREVARFRMVSNVPVGLMAVGFTPDWTKAIMIEIEEGNRFGSLYVTALDGSHRELLDSQVPYEFMELGPVISPDGEWVALLHISGSNQTPTLSVTRLDGSGHRELFSGATYLGGGQAPAGLPIVWLPAP